MPSNRLCFCSLLSLPNERTAYSRSKPKRGCMSWLASSPELVKSNRPSVFKSKRPTDCHLPWYKRGKRRNTVGRFCGSSCVTTSPAGLWYAITRGAGGAIRTLTNLPLTLIWSPNCTLCPTCAGSWFTDTWPSAIRRSISMREPNPDWARTLCNLGDSAWGKSTRLSGVTSSLAKSASNWPDTTSENSMRGASSSSAGTKGISLGSGVMGLVVVF